MTEAFCSFVSLNKSLDCSSFVLYQYNKWFLCEMISEIPSIFQVIDSVVLIEKNITARGFLLKPRLLVSWLLISVKVKSNRLCTLCGLVIMGILCAVCRDAEWLNPGTRPPFENVFKRNVFLGAGQ